MVVSHLTGTLNKDKDMETANKGLDSSVDPKGCWYESQSSIKSWGRSEYICKTEELHLVFFNIIHQKTQALSKSIPIPAAAR